MFKRLLSLTMAVMMVMALVVIPAQAATFSDANIVYTDVGGVQQKWDSNMNVVESTTYSTNRYNYVHLKRKSSGGLSADKKLVRVNCDYGPGAGDYDGTVNYAHSRFYVAINEGNSTKANLLVMLNYYDGSNDGRVEKIFTIESRVNSFYPAFKDADTTFVRYEPTGEGPFKVRHNTGDWEYNQIDLIVDVDGAKSGMVYGFINGQLYGYTRVDASKLDYNSEKIYHGYTVAARSGNWTSTNDQFKFKLADDNVRSTIYANTSDYTVSIEDIMKHQGLNGSLPETDEKVVFATKDLETYMPGNTSWAFTDTNFDCTEAAYNSYGFNKNVSYNEDMTVATIAQNTSEKTEAASMLRGGYPLNSNVGIGYSNYKNVARFIRLSFDQQIEKGTVEYGVANPNYTKGVSFFQSNDATLSVSVQGQSEFGYTNAVINDVAFNEKAHIDWVYDTVEKVQYVFVNEKFISKGTIGKSRIGDIRIMTTGDTSVTIDNWSMTLYNNDQTFDELRFEITGDNGETTFGWMDDNCFIDYDAESGDFVVSAGAEATNYDGSANFIVALYAEDGVLLDADIQNFASGDVVGDEVEPKMFNVNDYEKDIATISVFLWELDGIKPLIVQKELDF